jgi:hypothetical protein
MRDFFGISVPTAALVVHLLFSWLGVGSPAPHEPQFGPYPIPTGVTQPDDPEFGPYPIPTG